ncbi:MAG: hypothetical protein QUS35_05930 [bacterium]|nr:hypothetical protein [bacterium]
MTSVPSKADRPGPVTLIAAVNAAGFFFSILFWAFVAFRLYFSHAAPAVMDPATAASTFGFLVADCVVALPLLLIGWVWLLRMSFFGWTAAQMANVLWVYALLAVWARDLHAGRLSPGSFVFLPFAFFAVWAFLYLWRKRGLFTAGGL